MADVLTVEQRRLNMSRVRGCDTKPELILRLGLHARGLRFRLHRKDLPGVPIWSSPFPRGRVRPRLFWHGHDCPMFKLPVTRAEFWAAKIKGTGHGMRVPTTAWRRQAGEQWCSGNAR